MKYGVGGWWKSEVWCVYHVLVSILMSDMVRMGGGLEGWWGWKCKIAVDDWTGAKAENVTSKNFLIGECPAPLRPREKWIIIVLGMRNSCAICEGTVGALYCRNMHPHRYGYPRGEWVLSSTIKSIKKNVMWSKCMPIYRQTTHLSIWRDKSQIVQLAPFVPFREYIERWRRQVKACAFFGYSLWVRFDTTGFPTTNMAAVSTVWWRSE